MGVALALQFSIARPNTSPGDCRNPASRSGASRWFQHMPRIWRHARAGASTIIDPPVASVRVCMPALHVGVVVRALANTCDEHELGACRPPRLPGGHACIPAETVLSTVGEPGSLHTGCRGNFRSDKAGAQQRIMPLECDKGQAFRTDSGRCKAWPKPGTWWIVPSVAADIRRCSVRACVVSAL